MSPAPAPAPSSLPTTIPTYDDSSLSPVKTPLPQPKAIPTPPKATVEKEAAMVAAQAVASKLQEMQVAKEEERRRRKELKMAERLAAQLTEQVPPVEEQVQEAAEVSRGGGRILDMVERQEGRAREGGQEERREAKQRRKRKEKDSPLLITLKPFYRPNEKNGKKKKVVRELTEAEEAALEESFVPRSPVPLPDSSGLKPSLVKPYLGVKVSLQTLFIPDNSRFLCRSPATRTLPRRRLKACATLTACCPARAPRTTARPGPPRLRHSRCLQGKGPRRMVANKLPFFQEYFPGRYCKIPRSFIKRLLSVTGSRYMLPGLVPSLHLVTTPPPGTRR